MTIRHMIIFRTVCENGYNSTKAAEVLHMTQPAVSLAIKELEQYYGVHLFDRIGRRLQITDAGQHFLQYAIHISSSYMQPFAICRSLPDRTAAFAASISSPLTFATISARKVS